MRTKTTKKLSSIAFMLLLGTAYTYADNPALPDSTQNSNTSKELDEVVVTVKKPIVEATGEKIGYNVEQDPEAASNTVLEMLRKVPMVSVDGQDNILINGQSNFKIYVNGKEDPMLNQNASTILKSMPASSIKKIEVLLEPGAKYDAEGTGGILNIITIGKKVAEGYLSTFTLGGSNRNITPSVYARTKIKNVTMSVDASYYNQRLTNNKNSGEIYRKYYSAEPAEMLQKMQSIQKNEFLDGSFQMSWEPDSINLFNAGVNGYGAWGDNINNTTTRNLTSTHQLLSSNFQRLNTHWTWSSLTANASWQHTFSSVGRMIVASYQYSHGWDSNKMWQNFSDLVNYEPQALWILNNNDNPTNEHTLQIDYTHPFSSKWTLESGAKGILRRNYGTSSTFIGDEQSKMNEITSAAVDMRQYQNVAAIYATAHTSLGKWQANVGVRYEYTNMGVKFKTQGYDNFSSNLNDIVPNAAITYVITPASNLRAGYQMRIHRPGVSELNPHESVILADYIQKGNPDLTSEKNHQISLTYSNFGNALGGNIKATYSTGNNMISHYTYKENDAIITTYDNVGKMNNLTLAAYVMWRCGYKINLSIDGSVSYLDYKFKAADMSNNGWMGRFGINFAYTMPWQINFNAYGGMSTRRIMLQGHSSGWDYHGISFSKNFLQNKKLKISIYAANFLHAHSSYSSFSKGNDYQVDMKYSFNTFRIGASISYTFGSLKDNLKKTANSIVNDDIENTRKGES